MINAYSVTVDMPGRGDVIVNKETGELAEILGETGGDPHFGEDGRMWIGPVEYSTTSGIWMFEDFELLGGNVLGPDEIPPQVVTVSFDGFSQMATHHRTRYPREADNVG